MLKKVLNFAAKFLLPILPFLVVFVASLENPKDPDLGWHLKYGEYFFQNFKLLKDNTFSTDMVNFQWANTSWLTDLISYAFFAPFGFFGITVLGAAIITLTFFVFSKLAKLTLWDQTLLFPILIFFEFPLNIVSFKGQMFSILFLGVMFYLLDRFAQTKDKRIYFLVPLFLIWSNLHGQFILGIALFLVWIFFKITSDFFLKDRDLKLLLSLFKFFSVLTIVVVIATLINPFGSKVYQTTLSHFSNPDIKYIAEYLPIDGLSIPWWNQIFTGMLLLFGVLFLLFTDQIKSKVALLGIVGVLYGMSFYVRRYAWSLYYLTLPLLKPLSTFFKPDSNKNTNLAAFTISVLMLVFIIYLKMPISNLYTMNWDRFCKEAVACSNEVARFMLTNKPKGELLTFYDWGGWLIWNYPEIKPSIDGRMHLWKDENGYSAFSYYYPIEQNWRDIDETKYDLSLMSPKKPVYYRLLELVDEGKWKILYKDDYAALFQKVRSE